MCGISGVINHPEASQLIKMMTAAQAHRGSDATGFFEQFNNFALGHNRLSIIDLSEKGNQPLYSSDNRYVIVFNGEVYNYLELRARLKCIYPFVTQTDTEVVLAAWINWGKKCLDEFIGMFSFVIWDTIEKRLFAARDRFGVKPFHYSIVNGTFLFASEIKAIHATGLIKKESNQLIWATYFANALDELGNETFWKGINRLPAGHTLIWEHNQIQIERWYNLAGKIKPEQRKFSEVQDELLYILEDAVKLRFRADVPVGVCLSGGVDSSLLLALIQKVKGKNYPIHAFTFYTGDSRYDELADVRLMIQKSGVIHHACKLEAGEVPLLAEKIAYHMDEPFGGIPTLGMSKVFEKAAELGIKVVLDGNGMDEGWVGYDYYHKASEVNPSRGPVQGSTILLSLEDCLKDEFKLKAMFPDRARFHPDPLINLQLRDILVSKIPRALRFADRNSMAYSIELREPFLDHRIIELGLCQPMEHQIQNGVGKYMVRAIARQMIPRRLSETGKRAVQTPQREWLAVELQDWVQGLISKVDESEYFRPRAVSMAYEDYQQNLPDNSFHIWQIVSGGLLLR